MTETEITELFGERCAEFDAGCAGCYVWRAHDEYATLVGAARQVVAASTALTLHSDGRSYFDCGADTERFRGALSDLRARLEDVT